MPSPPIDCPPGTGVSRCCAVRCGRLLFRPPRLRAAPARLRRREGARGDAPLRRPSPARRRAAWWTVARAPGSCRLPRGRRPPCGSRRDPFAMRRSRVGRAAWRRRMARTRCASRPVAGAGCRVGAEGSLVVSRGRRTPPGRGTASAMAGQQQPAALALGVKLIAARLASRPRPKAPLPCSDARGRHRRRDPARTCACCTACAGPPTGCSWSASGWSAGSASSSTWPSTRCFVHGLGVDYRVANVVAWLVAVLNNFVLNRHWTFDAREGARTPRRSASWSSACSPRSSACCC